MIQKRSAVMDREKHGREELPLTQGLGLRWHRKGLEELPDPRGQGGGREGATPRESVTGHGQHGQEELTPLRSRSEGVAVRRYSLSKVRRLLCFAGTGVKRYPIPR